MCTADCECEKCKNTEANDLPGGSRNKAVAEIMLRRPDAFKETVRINPILENVPVIKVRLNPPTWKVVSKKKAKKEPRFVYGMGSPPTHSEQQYDMEAV
jgi:hypothetical protein